MRTQSNITFIYSLIFLSAQLGYGTDFNKRLNELKHSDPAWKELDLEERAEEVKNFSRSLFWTPKLSLVASQNDSYSSLGNFNRLQAAGFTAQWNLWKNGSDWAAWVASRARLRAATAKTRSTKQKLLGEYSKLLFDLEKVSLSRDIVQAQNKIQEKSLNVSRKRYEGGQLSKSELEKIELDTLLLRERSDEQERLFLDAQDSLKQRVSSTSTLGLWPWKNKLLKLNKPTEIPSLIDSIQVQILNEEVAAESADKFTALADLGPSLDLSASYGRDYEHWKRIGRENRWGIGISLSWVIFDGAKEYAAYRAAAYSSQIKKRNLLVSQRTNAESWDALWRKLNSSIVTAMSRESLQEKTKEMLNRSQALFLSGRIDVNTLSIDQNRWLEARLRLVDSWYQAHMSLVEICTQWEWEGCPEEIKP